MVIVVNGQGGSGKDSFVQACKDARPDLRYQNLSIADFAKLVAKIFISDEVKTDAKRRLLSDLTDAFTRYDDVPFKSVCKAIEHPFCDTDIHFVMARDPKDIQRFKDRYKAITILLQRGDYRVYGNHADDSVFDFPYDYVIDNNGTIDELKETAKTFMEDVTHERNFY